MATEEDAYNMLSDFIDKNSMNICRKKRTNTEMKVYFIDCGNYVRKEVYNHIWLTKMKSCW